MSYPVPVTGLVEKQKVCSQNSGEIVGARMLIFGNTAWGLLKV